MDEAKVKVGFLFSPKKLAKLQLLSIIAKSKRSNLIQLIMIDPYQSLAEQHLTNLDIIIHRVYDHVNMLEGLDPDLYIAKLIEETTKYNIKLLSPFGVIELLADRMRCIMTINKLTLLSFDSFTLKLPPMVEINVKTPRNEVVEICKKFNDEFLQLKYPKDRSLSNLPNVYTLMDLGGSIIDIEIYSTYNFDKLRYMMCLYFKMDDSAIDGIVGFIESCSVILQPFYNHDGMLFKLFILDNKWHLETRPSIKNFDFTKSNDNIIFHSNKISKCDSYDSTLHDYQNKIFTDSENCDPFLLQNFSTHDFDVLVNYIKKCIPCPLLGIDMLMESNTRDMFIVDVNYFPGFDGILALKNKLRFLNLGFSKSYDLGEAFIDLFLEYSKGGSST